MQEVLNQAITNHPEQDGVRHDGDQALWDKIPPFTFTFEALDLRALALRHGLPLLALFTASLLLCGAGLRHLRSGNLR
jgi:ABC-2 type transport system permease protein